MLRALLGSLGRRTCRISYFVSAAVLCTFPHRLPRTEDTEIPDLSIVHHLLDKLKERLHLAKQIDALAHRVRKEKHERSWIREAADAMDIELGSDLEDECVARLLISSGVGKLNKARQGP